MINQQEVTALLDSAALYPPTGWSKPVRLSSASGVPQQAGSERPIIRLVACGGAGIAMAGNIDKAQYKLSSIIAIDTDITTIRKAKYADQALLLRPLGQQRPKTFKGVQALAAAQQSVIKQVLSGADMVIVVAGLGGAAGTGIASMIPYFTDDSTHLTAVLCLPFAFESARTRRATQTHSQLAERYDNALTLPLDNITQMQGEEATIGQTLAEAEKPLAQYLKSTSRQLHTHNFVLGFDFEDYCIALNGSNGPVSSSIGWGSGTGAERAHAATEIALGHPGLRQPLSSTVCGIVVSVWGGDDMKAREINSIINQIRARYSGNMGIVIAANRDKTQGGQIEVSIVLSNCIQVLLPQALLHE